MASIQDRIEEIRQRRPFVDHLVRMVQHFGAVKGNQQAGAVTYFGFLSFFPILALAFFTIGYVAKVYPDAQNALIDALNEVLPGLIGTGDGEISLTQIQDAAGAVGLIGLAGVLYAGLGWLSAMRDGLNAIFDKPLGLQPSFVLGKLRDLLALALIGLVLVLSVGVSGVVTRFSGDLLDLVGLGTELSWLISLFAVVLGLATNMVLFFVMFRLLADPQTPKRALWSGALLGAVGFELLKQLSSLLLAGTKGQPAFQAFGIALILLVWINYFSRVVMYAAAWAHTAPEARAQRVDGPAPVQGPPSPSLALLTEPGNVRAGTESVAATEASKPAWVAPFAAGGAAMLAVTALVRRRKRSSRTPSRR